MALSLISTWRTPDPHLDKIFDVKKRETAGNIGSAQQLLAALKHRLTRVLRDMHSIMNACALPLAADSPP